MRGMFTTVSSSFNITLSIWKLISVVLESKTFFQLDIEFQLLTSSGPLWLAAALDYRQAIRVAK